MKEAEIIPTSRIMKSSFALALAGCLTLAAACHAPDAVEPASSSPEASLPKSTPGDAPGVVPGGVFLAGVYNVSAPITGFDPAWGDFTGYVYTATFTIQRHPTDGSRLIGSYANFALIDASGKVSDWRSAGTIGGVVDPTGRVTLELKSDDGSFSWWGQGNAAGSRIEGRWGRGGHLSGPFAATLVEPKQ